MLKKLSILLLTLLIATSVYAQDYYVDATNGNDGNLGTAPGAGNAFQTIQKGFDTATAGDTVFIKDDTYNIAAKLDLDTNEGDVVSGYITYEGYGTVTGDDTVVTITATAAIDHVVDITNNFNYYYFKNLDFDGNNNTGTVVEADNGADNGEYLFVNCKFQNSNTAHGCDVDDRSTFINCYFYSNGNGNADAGIITGQLTQIFGCSFVDGYMGIDLAANSVVANCIFYNNSHYAIDVGGAYNTVINNTVLAGANGVNHGIYVNAARNRTILNNIIKDFDTAGMYGMYGVNADDQVTCYEDYTCFFNNDTDENITFGGDNSFNSDPDLTNEAGGDFSPSSTSPVRGSGFPGTFLGVSTAGFLDIGAAQESDDATGGGLTSYGFAI